MLSDLRERLWFGRISLYCQRQKAETGRVEKSWQPKENRICGQRSTGEAEAEMHFLLQCKSFNEMRNIYFNKFNFRFQRA